MSNINRVPLSEWRRQYYAVLKGAPSVAALKESIDNNQIPGKSIAGKYHIDCDNRYEPLWSLLEENTQTPKIKVKSALAARILQEEGLS